MTRVEAVTLITAALLSNPERYKYIAEKVANNELTQDEATAKNVAKASFIVDEIERCEGVFQSRPPLEGIMTTEKAREFLLREIPDLLDAELDTEMREMVQRLMAAFAAEQNRDLIAERDGLLT